MPLLVEAYEHCRGPEDAGEPPLDRAGFKALVRELDLWCSSCMVALEGDEPVAVLFGAKRAEATLVHTVRVHPAHRRRGHGRHLLTSLGRKLAILGPPRLVAEVPAERAPARALFEACRWRHEERLIDWRRARLRPTSRDPGEAGAGGDVPVAPITLEEAAASGLLDDGRRAWHRDLPALERQGERLLGLGFFSPERLEAFVLHRRGAGATDAWELLAVGCARGELARAALRVLVSELERQADGAPLEISRAATGELDSALLAELGFTPGAEHLLFATEAKAA